jgi:hypothetical protein
MPLIQKMRYKEFELDFGRKLAEASEEANLPVDAELDSVPSLEGERVIELARVSPRAAVTEAWRWVELATLEAAQHLLGEEFRNKSLTFRAIRDLERDERMDRGAVLLMRDLRSLRNKAVHSPEFALTEETALEYAELAKQLVGYLRTVGTPDRRFQLSESATSRIR